MYALRTISILIFLIMISPLLFAVEPVERIAAVVNGEIVFLSDLQRYRLFFEPVETKEASPSETLGNPLKVLDGVIHHRLLRKDARRFVLQGPSEAEIDQKLKSIRQRFNEEAAFLKALDETGFSLEGMKEEIREHLWVERLLHDRIRSFIFITPKQVEKYYQDHAEEFKDKKLGEVEPTIRKILTEEKEVLKTKEYLARLRDHADIQINLKGSPSEAPPGPTPGQLSSSLPKR
jgi:hypothetical protein